MSQGEVRENLGDRDFKMSEDLRQAATIKSGSILNG